MKRMLLAAASAAVLALGSAPASAANPGVTAAQLQSICESNETSDRQSCLDYISGASDALTRINQYLYSKREAVFCQPGYTITHNTLVSITDSYIREHPEVLNHNASDAVTLAVMQTWPCR